VTTAEAEERGAGLLSTSFGIGVFLVFVLFAVQLLVNLYATSVVTSATYDAARHVATHGSQPPTQAELDDAVQLARDELGRYGRGAVFAWDLSDPAVIALHVHVVNPRLLGPGVDQLVGLDTIDRTVVVRAEQPR
jgi:Flp pilus assembly protein TadG